jgi:hypothetical protein
LSVVFEAANQYKVLAGNPVIVAAAACCLLLLLLLIIIMLLLLLLLFIMLLLLLHAMSSCNCLPSLNLQFQNLV